MSMSTLIFLHKISVDSSVVMQHSHDCTVDADDGLCNVKRIGRCLKRTSDKGIIFKFDATKGIDVHADADFTGSWFNFNSHELESALSRTGYIIKFANCQTCWVSKLQTEASLLTTEAECVSLSQSIRDLKPIKNTIELLSRFIRVNNKEINTCSTIFEDNAGMLQLATEPKHQPRKKHICAKHHHFRQHVKNKTISIKSIDANNQQADVFAKPLALEKFKKFRKLIMGW